MTVREFATRCGLSSLRLRISVCAVSFTEIVTDVSHELLHVGTRVIAGDVGMQILPSPLDFVVVRTVRREKVQSDPPSLLGGQAEADLLGRVDGVVVQDHMNASHVPIPITFLAGLYAWNGSSHVPLSSPPPALRLSSALVSDPDSPPGSMLTSWSVSTRLTSSWRAAAPPHLEFCFHVAVQSHPESASRQVSQLREFPSRRVRPDLEF